MAALAGLAVALLFLWMPVGLFEMVVASSGLSEALPAAAPPLGFKARLIMAGFAGLMAIGVVGLARRESGLLAIEDGKGRAHRVQGAHKMGFAFSKLTALARGRSASDIDQDAPVLRRADAHPDAPSRPPIFASRDFDGIDIFPRTDSVRRPMIANRQSDRDTVVPLSTLTMPSAPEPLAEADLPQPAFLRPAGPFAAPTLVEDHDGAEEVAIEPVAQAVEVEWTVPEPAPAPIQSSQPQRPAPLPMGSTHGLSIAELTERLERGLSNRTRTVTPPASTDGVIADMPVASAVPVRAAVERDADEALRVALGTLRAMAGRR